MIFCHQGNLEWLKSHMEYDSGTSSLFGEQIRVSEFIPKTQISKTGNMNE